MLWCYCWHWKKTVSSWRSTQTAIWKIVKSGATSSGKAIKRWGCQLKMHRGAGAVLHAGPLQLIKCVFYMCYIQCNILNCLNARLMSRTFQCMLMERWTSSCASWIEHMIACPGIWWLSCCTTMVGFPLVRFRWKKCIGITSLNMWYVHCICGMTWQCNYLLHVFIILLYMNLLNKSVGGWVLAILFSRPLRRLATLWFISPCVS